MAILGRLFFLVLAFVSNLDLFRLLTSQFMLALFLSQEWHFFY